MMACWLKSSHATAFPRLRGCCAACPACIVLHSCGRQYRQPLHSVPLTALQGVLDFVNLLTAPMYAMRDTRQVCPCACRERPTRPGSSNGNLTARHHTALPETLERSCEPLLLALRPRRRLSPTRRAPHWAMFLVRGLQPAALVAAWRSRQPCQRRRPPHRRSAHPTARLRPQDRAPHRPNRRWAAGLDPRLRRRPTSAEPLTLRRPIRHLLGAPTCWGVRGHPVCRERCLRASCSCSCRPEGSLGRLRARTQRHASC
jgi:hypothetical protein